ncbi:MAG: DUF3137 domain-containing protein [bacterium]|nr:DUF3137 domain-containing protein [bacterium]
MPGYTLENFDGLYEHTIKPKLSVIEANRKRVLRKMLLIWGIAVIAVFAVYFYPPITEYLSFAEIPIILPIIISAVIFAVTYCTLKSKYELRFKRMIIKDLVELISDDLEYCPEQYVSKADFLNSKIFSNNIDDVIGDDLIVGRVSNIKCRFSELHAYKRTRRTSNSKSGTKYIFSGIFFIIDTDNFFKGETFIFPDSAERLLGATIGRKLQSLKKVFSNAKLVVFDDKAFEKNFAVFSSDSTEAKSLLSSSFIGRLNCLKEKIKGNISMSFVGKSIYIALPKQKNYLQPRFFRTAIKKSILENYLIQLLLITGIVDDLNININYKS